MPPSTAGPLASYLVEVRRVRASQQGTPEQSFYPAMNALLTALGQRGTPAREVLAHPAGVRGNLPDVALYERGSNVLSLPVEVKPPETSLDTLLASAQARSYAQNIGGGIVLLTNVREFAIGRLDAAGVLQKAGHVEITATAGALDQAPPAALAEIEQKLQLLIEDGCQVRGAITEPAQVARLLALHATRMRDAIAATGNVDALLAPISAALRDGLQIDVQADLLVPTVVQTLVYGLFAAWLESEQPGEFSWMDTAYALEVPVFADVLHAALRPQLVRASGLTHHLDAIARVLAWTDRQAFAAQFDGAAIEYFYEPFLAAFDQPLRDRLGVWYTPREVAEYQVARADYHLKHDLGFADGLADPAVYILDPACGTGTYLAAVLRHIYAQHLQNGEPEAVAVARTREAAITRVIGFEVLPAAFIICHLNLVRMLHRMGAATMTDERVRVYLTNTLTGWDKTAAPAGSTLFPELEEELRNAAAVKHIDPVVVVLGNPPYEGYSSAETEEERRMLSPWIEPLWPQWGVRKHRLNDLYVRFWRVAVERIVNVTDRGIVTFITNRKWLAGRSYPAMREAIMTGFDQVVVDDLHGAADDASHPGDQSVFSTGVAGGIKRGTAIVTAVRTGPRADDAAPAQVTLRDHWGSATAKRAALRPASLTSGFVPVTATASSWWRLSTRASGDATPVDDYLPFFRSGVQPVRDEAVLDTDENALRTRMRDYFDHSLSFTQVVQRHPGFGVVRARYDPERTRSRLLQGSAYHDSRVVRVLYRPFDVRWMYWEPDFKLLNEARRELIPYWRNAPRQRCLVLPQTPRRLGALRPVISAAVGYNEAAEPNARLFPLYKPESLLAGAEASNLPLDVGGGSGTLVADTWAAAASACLGLTDDTAAGETVFYALVAVMHSPAWQALQGVELDDFPEVALPGDPIQLAAAAALGRRIADLTDPTVPVPGVTSGMIDPALAVMGVPDAVAGTVPVIGAYGTRGGRRRGQDVLWAEDQGWRNVPDAVWGYVACGFPVVPKWLSYRVRTGLSGGDRNEVMLIVRRLAALLALEPACDKAYLAAIDSPLTL